MTHSQLRTLEPAAIEALDSSPENSVYKVLQQADGPMLFDSLVERVQGRRPQVTRAAIAASLAVLINKRRAFLNQERTGFVVVRRDESKQMQRAQARTLSEARA